MKLSHYNHFVPALIEGQTLAYNSLSGAFLVLSDEQLYEVERLFEAAEMAAIDTTALTETQQHLLDAGFVIADELDERSVIHHRYYDGRDHVEGLSLTVTPTVNCNFGCGYCFQSHSNRKMTAEDIENLKQFAAERLKPDTHLSITWFGGEPLTAFDVIEQLGPYFYELAVSRRCGFSHAMITNGYLLTAEKAQFIGSIPNFSYAQITLDGAPSDHDKRRMTLGNQGTFERILRNIKAAVPYIPISIRVNVDRRNIEGLPLLLQRLKAEGLAQHVGVYLAHVWEYTAEVEESDFLTKEEFATVQSQFQFMKFRMGFTTNRQLPTPKRGNQCVADHPNGYVASPNGLLFNCWNEVHLPANEASGRYDGLEEIIYLDVINDNNQRWATYDPFVHDPCQTCKVAPLCMSGCPWESRKNPTFATGYCTPLRFNLPDHLRLFHLQATVQRSLSMAEAKAEVEPCNV